MGVLKKVPNIEHVEGQIVLGPRRMTYGAKHGATFTGLLQAKTNLKAAGYLQGPIGYFQHSMVKSYIEGTSHNPPAITKLFLQGNVKWDLDRDKELRSLREENNRLSREIASLRAVVRKVSAQQSRASEAAEIAPYSDRTAAAEMLAQINAEEFELIVSALEVDKLWIPELIRNNGNSLSLIRAISLVAHCRAAIVDGDLLIPTEFGRRLCKWIVECTIETSTQE